MRKWILTSLILILSSTFVLGDDPITPAPGATNGVCTKIITEGDYTIFQYTLAQAVATDSETFTFGYTGFVVRIAVNTNATDADGDITISDISGLNYVNWENFLAASADVDYFLEGTSKTNNVGLGYPTAGTHLATLTNCAGAAPITITIYCKN